MIIKQLAVLALVVIGLSSCVVEGTSGLYDYYYYPSASVYFNIHSGYYRYYDHGRWIRSSTLPPTIHLSPRDRHFFQTREPEPFHRNRQYQERFKPTPHYQPNAEHDRQERRFDRDAYNRYKRKNRR